METGSRRGRARYVAGFFVLVILTALELGVIRRLDVEHAARVTALCGLAMAKVALLLWVFMDLRAQPRVVKVLALAPLLFAPGFTNVLMLDTVHRLVAAR
jgi:heme/copper-type cytochrome/quinol oxidase subunit 4